MTISGNQFATTPVWTWSWNGSRIPLYAERGPLRSDLCSSSVPSLALSDQTMDMSRHQSPCRMQPWCWPTFLCQLQRCVTSAVNWVWNL